MYLITALIIAICLIRTAVIRIARANEQTEAESLDVERAAMAQPVEDTSVSRGR